MDVPVISQYELARHIEQLMFFTPYVTGEEKEPNEMASVIVQNVLRYILHDDEESMSTIVGLGHFDARRMTSQTIEWIYSRIDDLPEFRRRAHRLMDEFDRRHS